MLKFAKGSLKKRSWILQVAEVRVCGRYQNPSGRCRRDGISFARRRVWLTGDRGICNWDPVIASNTTAIPEIAGDARC